MKDSNYLEVNNLHVHFAGKRKFLRGAPPPIRAVNGVSFGLEPSKTLGLVGESGSGKSTIARAILKLTPTHSGSINVDGDEVTELSGSALKDFRKEVQVVFQDPYSSLNPSLTVNEIVGDLLEEVGLGRHFLERFPYELSGGQRQRVAIARALSVQPKLIICDEATSALDVSIQSQVINLLEDIQDSTGVAFLFIAHDLTVVRHISDDTPIHSYAFSN